MELHQRGYKWKQATEESELVVSANLGIHGGFHLRASGKNCDKLKQIYESRIKPNYDAG
jgi:hypothetical protein